jgi:hypothetical protein
MKPHTQFLLSAGVTIVLLSLVFYWLGPVWMHEVQLYWIGVLAGVGVVLAFLIHLGAEKGGVAELIGRTAEASVRATMAGGRLLRSFSGRFWPAVLGSLAGGVLALGGAWGFSQTESVRLAYARARPEQALDSDFTKVAPIMDEFKKLHRRPPQDMTELLGTLRQAGFSPRYSVFRGDRWDDAWGNPFRYRAKKRLIGWNTELYSIGPDGVDSDGGCDDLSASAIFLKWKVDQFLTAPVEEGKK